MSFPKHRLTAGAVVLREDDKLLLIHGPRRGWELPGGHVEEGESVHDALKREVKEETGIDIEIVRFCGISQEVGHSMLNTWWLAKPISETIKTSNESLEVRFVDVDEAMKLITNEVFIKEVKLIMDINQHPFHMVWD